MSTGSGTADTVGNCKLVGVWVGAETQHGKRHNKAGTAIVRAIRAGNKGAALVAAGVGLRIHSKDNEDPLTLPRTVPFDMLPRTMPRTVKHTLTCASIPDIFLYEEDPKTQRRKYTIVEIKYCRDTRQEDQEARAEQQHAAMQQQLKQYDPLSTVECCVLLLGVSGVIFKQTVQRLTDKLGVEGPLLKNLLTQLHHIAVEGLGKAWNQRRMLIAQLPGMKGKGKAYRHRVSPHRKTRKKRATKR